MHGLSMHGLDIPGLDMSGSFVVGLIMYLDRDTGRRLASYLTIALWFTDMHVQACTGYLDLWVRQVLDTG